MTVCESPVLSALLSVPPAGEDVTVYPVIAEPPFPLAVKVTMAVVLPLVAVPILGAEGTVDGITELLALLAELFPAEL